jgi:2-iminoacetate synthase ThiH
VGKQEPSMSDNTEIEWHKEQIAKNRALLEELEAGNTAGGDVFPETQSEIERLKAQTAQSELIRRLRKGTSRKDLTGPAWRKAGAKMVFIVQGKPRQPEGIVKVTKDTRKDALETANDFMNQGIPFVTIIADGRIYTVEEFAMTIINGER